ncbi:MAG: hypothetical protein CBHOC_3972 [uncultured Caballeronia sp.]|nr:MAG: hypothetical protein CBHOC_3972 [uncultured Caballeronia sp.]
MAHPLRRSQRDCQAKKENGRKTTISALLDSILTPWVKELRLAPESTTEGRDHTAPAVLRPPAPR